MKSPVHRLSRWLCLGGAALGLLACAGAAKSTIVARGEGLDVAALPPEIRADYELFAQRCSKCHALSRALNSDIDEDEYWKLYVERMRRQPSSGISPGDEVGILRFLHYLTQQQRVKKTSETAPARVATQPARPL